MRSWFRILIVGAITAAATISVAGCTSDNSEPAPLASKDLKAVAVLNSSSEQIAFPLSKYYANDREVATILEANNVLMTRCVENAHHGYPLSVVDYQTIPPDPNWRYGPWSESWVKRYGYNIPVDATVDRAANAVDQALRRGDSVLRSCLSTAEHLPVLGADYGDADAVQIKGIADEGVQAAAAAAAQDPRWAAARQAWWSCLKRHDLVPRTGMNEWGPVLPGGSNHDSAVAEIDVGCKQKTSLVKKLADIEAQYQAPFEAAHKSKLQALRHEVTGVVDRAKSIIASGS